MRRRTALAFLILISLSPAAFAASSTGANRVTTFNKVSDYLATLGKSESDKQEIIKHRREQRRDIRSQEELWRTKKQSQERMKQQEEAIMEKVNAERASHL